MDWFEFVILALATFRLTRLITRDVITESLRNRVWKKYPPESSKVGYLFTCEWCMSIWTASLLYGCFIITSVTVIVVVPLALSAVAGLLTAYEDK
jgi:hypothetical protein